MKNKLILLMFAFFFVNLISAVPPVTTVQSFNEGYNIQIPQDNVLKVGQDYNFYFHVFNISNGAPIISDIQCDFHLYDPNGSSLFYGRDLTSSEDNDYSFFISGNNFTLQEAYYYMITCNSTSLGGFSESILIVSYDGIQQTTAQGIMSFGYLILMICLTAGIGLLGFSFKDSEKLWVLGIFFIFLSILLLNYDFWLSYEFHKNLTGINTGSNLQQVIFVIFFWLFFIGIFVSAVLLIKNFKNIMKWLKKQKEEAQREEEEKEAELFD